MNDSSMERFLHGPLGGSLDRDAFQPDSKHRKIGHAQTGTPEEAAEQLRKALGLYVKEEGQNHDPLKLTLAAMINRKEADDISKESAAAIEAHGLQDVEAPSPELLLEMQEFAFRFKKRNPFAGEERVRQAVCNRFNIRIIPDAPAPEITQP